MEETGAYGERLRKTFKVARAPSFVAKTLKNARIAVTEIRCDKTNTGLSEPIPIEDAFLMTVQLRDVPSHRMFLDGQSVKTDFLPAGTANFYDLRSSPMADSISAFHHVSFYVPRNALIAITEKEGIPRIDAFNQNPGVGVGDPTMFNLVKAMLPGFRLPGLADQLFIDHLTVAATAHAVRHYACTSRQAAAKARPLSHPEQARAKEKLSEHIGGDLSLEDLSDECGMSPLKFAEAFESSVGGSIHAWRAALRIDRAKRLLAKGFDADTVAALLQYSYVTDFVRDFSRRTGLDPRNLTKH